MKAHYMFKCLCIYDALQTRRHKKCYQRGSSNNSIRLLIRTHCSLIAIFDIRHMLTCVSACHPAYICMSKICLCIYFCVGDCVGVRRLYMCRVRLCRQLVYSCLPGKKKKKGTMRTDDRWWDCYFLPSCFYIVAVVAMAQSSWCRARTHG